MAALSDSDRGELWAEFMRLGLRDPNDERRGVSITKGPLREAVNAIDDHLDAGGRAVAARTVLPREAELLADAHLAKLVEMIDRKRNPPPPPAPVPDPRIPAVAAVLEEMGVRDTEGVAERLLHALSGGLI